MKIDTILFPFTFSPRCEHAAGYVKAFAAHFQSEVVLLSVTEFRVATFGTPEIGLLPDEEATAILLSERRDALERFRAERFSGIQARVIVEAGDAAGSIVHAARAQKADLVMMPTHGHGPFRRFLLGSVTAKVLHDVECPVWTGVHMETAPPADDAVSRNILCAVDFESKSGETLRWAAQFAADCHANLVLFHAIATPAAEPEHDAESSFRRFLFDVARQEIEELQRNAGTSFKICLASGNVDAALRESVAEHRADLVIIGRSGHGVLGRLRAHSYNIIRESPCPVISI